MTFRRLNTIAALATICAVARADYVPYSTGEVLNLFSDLQYQILSDTTRNNGAGKAGWAFLGNPVVGFPNRPVEWANQGGALWISPSLDQSSNNVGAVTGATCKTSFAGQTVYATHFQLDTAAGVAAADLYAQILADDSVTVALNGKPVPVTGPANYTTPGIIHINAASGLALNNTVTFTVTNICGPTGLSVAWYGSLGSKAAFNGGSATGVSYSLTSLKDPVDSSTGMYFDSAVDLTVGGPMQLAFRRFQSSDFWNTGQQLALGQNWMSNFDLALGVTSTSANVLMFGGKNLSFTKSGSAWQLKSPNDIVYQLIPSGANYKLLDPTSNLVYTFLASGQLIRIEDRKGNALTITQGTFGPTTVSDGLGRTLTFTYTNGQLTKVHDQTGRAFTYAYDGRTLLTVTDDLGHTTKYTYITASGRQALIVAAQLPRGNTANTFGYDSNGRVISQTDGNNNITTLAYDGNGGTTITDPHGNITRQGSDSHGDATSQADPGGVTQSMTLDTANRRTNVTDGGGGNTSYLYHTPTGYPLAQTDPLGNTKTYSYTSQTQNGFTYYNLSGINYPDGTSEAFTFDSSGNVLTYTAQNGSITKSAYDALGRVTAGTAPDGSIVAYTWNAEGTLASETNAAGNKTTYAYDVLGRISQVTDANGGIAVYTRGEAADTSRTFSSKTPGTSPESLTYDFNGNLQDVVTRVGGTVHFTRTPTEKVASITDSLKNKTTYVYDANDQLSQQTDGADVVTTYAYDSGNRLQSVSSAAGVSAAYTYTANNLIASVADGLGNKTLFGYDSAGRLSTITSPAGNKSTMTYDKRGRLSTAADALGGTVTQTRDAVGRITQVSVRGASTTIAYNSLGLTASITSANGNKWTLSYDAAGRPTQVTDPLGNSTKSTYTGKFVTQQTLPLGTVAITNDADGRVTKRQYSDGTVLNAAYDTSGALISAGKVALTRDLNGQITNSNGIGITYDGTGHVASVTYAAGKTVTYGYDSSSRLASVTDWVGGKTALAYDAGSRVTSIAYPNGVTNTYAFNADSQIASIGYGSLGSIALTRDAAGKITSATRALPRAPVLTNSASQAHAYDAAGELVEATSDKLGRVTSQNGRTYTWNLASQMTSFVDGSNSESFTYDDFGLLNTVTTGSTTRSFVMNDQFAYPALSVVRQSGKDLRYYVYLPNGNLLYSVEADNTRHFYHFDEMGNTVMLTNDAGALTDSYAITPYGEIADHVGTTDNPFTWQGQFGVFQEGTGLYNMRARHYDASTARFISRDAFQSAEPASSEPYAYANGNPLLNIDPLGHNVSPIPGIVAAVWQGIVGFADATGKFLSAAAAAAAGWIESVVTPHLPPCVSNCPVYQAPHAPDEQQGVQFVPESSAPVTNSPLVAAAPSKCGAKPGDGAISVNWHIQNGILYDANGKQITFVISNDGGSIILNGGGNVVSNDGGSVVSNDGGSVVSNDGGSVVSNDGGSIILNGGGNVISNDGGSLIKLADGSEFRVGANGTLISEGGAGLVIQLPPSLMPGMPALINEGGNGFFGSSGSIFHP